jgi:hypothetical protein
MSTLSLPATKTLGGPRKNLTRPEHDPSTFDFDALEKGSSDFNQSQVRNNKLSTNTAPPTTNSNGQAPQTTEAPPNGLSGAPIECAEFQTYTNFPDVLRLSKYYTLGSLTTRPSASSYNLEPNRGLSKAQIACNLKGLAVNCLDNIKDKYSDMVITSGFRLTSHGSDHEVGGAADLQFTTHSFTDYYNIVQWIRDNVPYKQLLLEYKRKSSNQIISWIHIAYLANQKSPMRIGTLFDSSVVAQNAFTNYA